MCSRPPLPSCTTRTSCEWRRLAGEQVTITDVTDDFGVLVLAGPRAREVLSQCTATDLSNASFRWLTGKEVEVAGVKKVRLLRVNYVGELGWELHVPMADMPKVFDASDEGRANRYGLKLFGTYAMNSLRMEKAYRGWGSELTTEIDMFEASMERFIRLDKPDFIGRAASLSKHQRGARMKLVPLGGCQYGFGLRGQRTGLQRREDRGPHHVRRLRPCGQEIAGLRLCGPRHDSHGHRLRRSHVR